VDDVAELVTFGADRPAPGHWGIDDVNGVMSLMRGDTSVMAVAELPLAGAHNALNVLAAFALVADGAVAGSAVADSAADTPNAALAAAVAGFHGLPHRCRKVAERHGVSFVDDSKATNVGAALAALTGLGGGDQHPVRPRLILIAGGDGKGADFAALADPVRQFVKAVVLLGRDAPLLARALEGTAPITRVIDMAAAVQAAMSAAEPGDTVLLSPACASLDMYRNYAARGEAFAAAVEMLP
jgi:UDP-N-acetylmuramoylalanine--D-glutamate ligase